MVAQQVIEKVQNIRNKQPKIGTRKLYHILYEDLRTLGVGRDRLFDILKANHLLIKPSRSYQVTTNSHHRFRKHANTVKELEIERPEQVWVSDITYLGTRKNPMYLSLVTDAYSKKIMGYQVSNSLSTDLCIKSMKMAIKNRKYKVLSLIHHSDRGIQYCSNEYQQLLVKYAINCSMTESYDPYENAVAERINGILKQEFLIQRTGLSLELMRRLVKQSIEIYNNERPHWSCKMLTPEQMHQQSALKIKTYKTKKAVDLQVNCF